MLFNSVEFLIFLPIVFILYWFVFVERKIQNFLVVACSYIFYGWWDWRFLFLLVLTSFSSFYSGILMDRFEAKRRNRQLICASNVVLNLSILCIFKYYNFFVDSLETLLSDLFHYQLDWITLNIVLPVGISFYTFQALSYTIDVYRKDAPATNDIVEFFAFISFFPQLVAGPIERAKNLLPQFQSNRHFIYNEAVDGSRQMLWGFFKKLVIADNCATDLNPLWNSFEDYSGVNIWGLALLFTFQIYCDFSGYSDIAIGCARLFGIRLQDNFKVPYLSKSIPEFWRRWHISLMSWFRDYIYIPIGGSKRCRLITIRNTFVVFALSGLWHGANWTYVCWGLYHGILSTIYRLLNIKNKLYNAQVNNHIFISFLKVIQVIITFFFVVVGWVIFRSESISQAFDFICRMFQTAFSDFHPRLGSKYTIFFVIVLLILEYFQRDKRYVLEFPYSGIFKYRFVRWSVYVILFTVIFMFTFSGNSQQFIYFQF